MTQTAPSLPQAPIGVPAWAVRTTAAVVGLVPAVLAWIDPAGKLPHGAIQACVILAFLLVGAVIFLAHLILAAVHEYGWNLNAAQHIATSVESEVESVWPEIRDSYAAAKPALDQLPGLQGAIDALSADITDLKAKAGQTGLTPEALIAAFETATGQPWPFPKAGAPSAAGDPAATGHAS